MGLFTKKKNALAVTPKDNYIKTYGEVIKDVFTIGGFPLTLAVISGLIILAALVYNAIEALESTFPWLICFGALLLVSGTLLYIYETSWKRKMLQRALDRFDELSKIVLTKYLESKQQVDYETVKAALDLINAVTHADRENILSQTKNKE